VYLLADLLFAYKNKDADNPHPFEIEAVNNTVELLLEEYSGQKYTDGFFMSCKLS
jgi:hypothetical protein